MGATADPKWVDDGLKIGTTVYVELCSGELRRWRYLGSIAPLQAGWHDEESGLVFSESSLLYAWRVVREDDSSPV